MGRSFLVIAATLAFLGCSTGEEPQQMFEKASALTKVTAHVDAAVLYSPTGKLESDKALLDKAFQDNPTLKPQLGSDVIRVQRGQTGVVLMLCTADASKALLEDLSCTAQMDKHHWRDEPDRACTFSLDPGTCP